MVKFTEALEILKDDESLWAVDENCAASINFEDGALKYRVSNEVYDIDIDDFSLDWTIKGRKEPEVSDEERITQLIQNKFAGTIHKVPLMPTHVAAIVTDAIIEYHKQFGGKEQNDD